MAGLRRRSPLGKYRLMAWSQTEILDKQYNTLVGQTVTRGTELQEPFIKARK